MQTATWMTVIAGIVTLLITIVNWSLGNQRKAREEKDALSKKSSDAINSGDITGINDVIDRLRR